jgi:uncharacterized membrane protein SpoIIM required for sporulation
MCYNRVVDERAFVESKKQSWEELGAALDRTRSRGARSLSSDELRVLGSQYRTLVSDLSFARTQGASEGLVTYLNELAGRAHGVIYASRPARLRGIKTFIFAEFPAVFRRTVNYTLVAAMIFFLGWAASATSPEICDAVFPQKITAPPKDMKHANPLSYIDPSTVSSFIMTNNIQVGIISFAGGATAGIYTIYEIGHNGLVIGAMATKAAPVLGPEYFWSLIIPHGIIELLAIFMCGGAGLMIGASMIAPGNLRRVDSIRIAARTALKLFAGAVLFFVIAGTIEGFVTPSGLPDRFKIAFGGLTAVGLILYLGFAGRSSTNGPCP